MKESGRPPVVVPTSVAREKLSSILNDFRSQGAAADPVVFGSYRKPEGVMLSYETYERILDYLDDVAIAALVKSREGRTDASLGDVEDLVGEFGFDSDELRTA